MTIAMELIQYVPGKENALCVGRELVLVGTSVS